MRRLALALAAVTLAGPVAAQSLSTLLPQLSFPDQVVSPATKGCTTGTAPCPTDD
jgi:hypothetical protein